MESNKPKNHSTANSNKRRENIIVKITQEGSQPHQDSKNQTKIQKLALQLLFTLLLKSAQTFPSGDHCGFVADQYSPLRSFSGSAADPNVVTKINPCSVGLSQFSLAVVFRLQEMPPIGKSGVIFSYWNKVKILVEQATSGGSMVLKVWKEGETRNMFEVNLPSAPKTVFLWLGVEEMKSLIAVRHNTYWVADEDLNLSYSHSKSQKILKNPNFNFFSAKFWVHCSSRKQ